MKNWLWTMVLISLAALLVGCGAPDVNPQAEQALEAAQVTSSEALAPTPMSSPTAEEPTPTDILLPTAEEPTPTDILLPTAEEPTPTDILLPTAEEPTSTSTPLSTVTPTVAPPTVAPSATPAVVHTGEDIQRITPAEAKDLLDGGMAVLYDVRSAAQYRTQHAAGALSFPASDMAARYGELPTDKSLVFY